MPYVLDIPPKPTCTTLAGKQMEPLSGSALGRPCLSLASPFGHTPFTHAFFAGDVEVVADELLPIVEADFNSKHPKSQTGAENEKQVGKTYNLPRSLVRCHPLDTVQSGPPRMDHGGSWGSHPQWSRLLSGFCA